MEIKNVRLYREGEIVLCKHITIKGKSMESDEGCEYVESIKIKCRECGITHTIMILIN